MHLPWNTKIDITPKKDSKQTPRNTMQNFAAFIILQNFFLIDRSYLLHDKTKKNICKFISLTMICLILGIFITDVIESGFKLSKDLGIQIVIILILAFYASAAKWQGTFEAMDKLDQNCEPYLKSIDEINMTVLLSTIHCTVYLFISVISLYIYNFKGLTLVLMAMLTSVYDSELYFLYMIVKCCNIRLAKLEDASPTVGAKIYKYLILVTAHFIEDYSSRIMHLFFMAILKTIICISFFVLVNLRMVILLILIWHQVKSLYILSQVCLETDISRNICNRLAFCLATKLVSLSDEYKKTNSSDYVTMQRWYSSVLREKLQYTSGAVGIGLSIPFALFDVSINNMLIIVQIYAGYIKSN